MKNHYYSYWNCNRASCWLILHTFSMFHLPLALTWWVWFYVTLVR